MTTVIFQGIGVGIGITVGFALGGPAGAEVGMKIGLQVGTAVGGATDAALLMAGARALSPPGAIKSPDMGDVSIPNLDWGQPIPKVRGLARTSSTTLMWAPPLRKNKTTEKVGGKGGGQEVENTEYLATAGYQVGQGEIAGLKKIWFDGKLVCDFSRFTSTEVQQDSADFADQYLTIYKGTEDQPIDPIMDSYAPGLTPAYRGMAYIVLDEYPVDTATYPIITVEVAGDGSGDRPVIEAQAPLFNLIAEACLEAGISTDDFDISDIGDRIRGVSFNGVESVFQQFSDVMTAKFITPTSKSDKVHFLKRPRPLHRKEHSTPAIIGETGLIVNAYHDIAGREGYFDPNSGTSEGQLMMVRSCVKAYEVLLATDAVAAASYLARAVWMAEALIDAAYLTEPPSTPSLWVPHWLFAADKPVRTQTYVMAYPADFIAGVVTIPEGAPWYGEKVRTAIKAYANDGSYPLWENPYSAIIGTEYEVTDLTITPGIGAVVTIDTAITDRAPLVMTYDIGEEISVGDHYEAWPMWRTLESGEIACAADSLAWALDAYSRLYSATSTAKWNDAFEATKQSIQDSYDVDDGRAIFRPQPTTSAFSLAGTFESSSRPGISEANWTRNSSSGVVIGNIPSVTNPDKWSFPSKGPANAEAQYGRGITDTWRVTDTDIRLTIGASEAMTVYVWLDTAQTYSASTRFYAPVALAGNGDALETIDVLRTSFQTAQGAPLTLPSGATLYAGGISDWFLDAHLLYIKEIRPIPPIPLPYTPYVSPFTVNIFAEEIIDWRGSPGSGYQYPGVWDIIGVPAGVQEICDFLDAAQDDYVAKFPGNRGPFSPVYVWDRADGLDLGTPNTWTWEWYDPNTEWGGYQYRPLENTARVAYQAVNATAKTIATDFLTWIDANWTTPANGPPTNFPSTGLPTADYDEPHFAALIMRAAIWGHLAGISATLCEGLINRAWDYLENQYVSTGDFAGTWSSNENDWFGFWHAEIIEALGMLLDEGNAIRITLTISDTTIKSRLVASDTWLTDNTRMVTGLTEEDFGASERVDNTERPYRHKLKDPKILPSEVRVHFKDVTADYATNTRYYRPSGAVSSNVWDIRLPLAMIPQEAEEAAVRLGRLAERGQDMYEMVGSIDLYHYEAGDAMPVILGGKSMILTIEAGAFGWPGLMPMETMEQDARIYRDAVKTAFTPARAASAIQTPGPTDHLYLDIPMIIDGQAVPGLFFALSSRQGAWSGASLWQSLDGGVTYGAVASTVISAVVGNISGTLADGPTEIYDQATTITVTLDAGELESISEDLLLQGSNLCAIGSEANGWELLQFKTATLVDTDTYDLSFFLRGRHGSEHLVSTHVASEKFVLISGLDVYVAHQLAALGSVRPMKAVSNGTVIDDAVSFDATDTGIALKPYSPAWFAASRDGSDNVTFSWARRDRAGVAIPWTGIYPMSEAAESYEIDIYDGADIVRTLTATSESVEYTAAQQVTDFGSVQASIDAEVFQISATIGRGTGNRKTI